MTQPSRNRLRLGPAGERVPSSAGKPPKAPGRWRLGGGTGRGRGGGIVRTVAKWTLVAGIWAFVAGAAVLAWYAADLPDIDAALSPSRRPAVTILAADSSEIATVGDYFSHAVTIRELPPAVTQAVLATEDRRFFSHVGVDPFGLARALIANLRAGGVVQGGSTITQQAAKNLFLTPDRTMKRKIQELMLALWLEHKFSKDQILAIYLNRAYFGAGAYGIDAAARKYFERPATRLSTYQAALLAGLLKAPSRYNPLNNPELAEERAKEVLANMVDAGFLDIDQAKAAWRGRSGTVAARRATPSARYFVDWVMAQLPAYVSDRNRDLIVQTTLDPRLQRIAELELEAALESPAALQGDVGQAAIVALSRDGAIRVMVGGRDYVESPFNRATQASRQPGSAFKPIVFAAGLERGLAPNSTVEDAPIRIGGWEPKNFTGRYAGEVTLREALAQSLNTATVRVGQYAGLDRVVGVARRLGITSPLTANASLYLGASEVSLLELTGAYAAFANAGMGIWPYGIESVRDTEGRLVYERSGSGPGRVLAVDDAAALTDMLVAVVRSGTGRASDFGWPIAGKTGTSQNFRDAWFIGFSAELIAGVWMGNDDDRAMQKITGGSMPARLWRAFMSQAHAGLPVRSLPALRIDRAPIPEADLIEEPAPEAEGTVPADAEPSPADLLDRLIRTFGG